MNDFSSFCSLMCQMIVEGMAEDINGNHRTAVNALKDAVREDGIVDTGKVPWVADWLEFFGYVDSKPSNVARKSASTPFNKERKRAVDEMKDVLAKEYSESGKRARDFMPNPETIPYQIPVGDESDSAEPAQPPAKKQNVGKGGKYAKFVAKHGDALHTIIKDVLGDGPLKTAAMDISLGAKLADGTISDNFALTPLIKYLRENPTPWFNTFTSGDSEIYWRTGRSIEYGIRADLQIQDEATEPSTINNSVNHGWACPCGCRNSGGCPCQCASAEQHVALRNHELKKKLLNPKSNVDKSFVSVLKQFKDQPVLEETFKQAWEKAGTRAYRRQDMTSHQSGRNKGYRGFSWKGPLIAISDGHVVICTDIIACAQGLGVI